MSETIEQMPIGELLDRLDELATWLDDSAPVEQVTPWLIRRDLVREAMMRLKRIAAPHE